MTLRGNLDAPETALDALLQSVVCLEVGLILVRCLYSVSVSDTWFHRMWAGGMIV